MNTDDSPQDAATLADAISQLKELRGVKFKDMFPVFLVAILSGGASFLSAAGGGSTFFLPSVVIIFMTAAVIDIKDRKRTDVIVNALRHLNRKD